MKLQHMLYLYVWFQIVEQEMRQKKTTVNSLVPGADDPISESDILANEKRTRFSLSHDQDSIGNGCRFTFTLRVPL